MRLLIPIQDNITESFIVWLEGYIKRRLIDEIDIDYLLNLQDILYIQYGYEVDMCSIFLRLLDTIHHLSTKTAYIIEIGNNEIVLGTKLSYKYILKLINFGNLNIRGSHVVSNIFSDIRGNLNLYFVRYLHGMEEYRCL